MTPVDLRQTTGAYPLPLALRTNEEDSLLGWETFSLTVKEVLVPS